MKKICIIIPFFGDRFPVFFPFFLKTVEWNNTIDFLLFTDIPLTINLPNLSIVSMNLDEFNTLASQQIGLNINIKSSYKLCDFKPTYGLVFEYYLTNYDFWGYCDIDLLLGNIRKFISDNILTDYEIISSRSSYLSGFFALYKNVKALTNLFYKSANVREILEKNIDKNYFFDESGNETMPRLYKKYNLTFTRKPTFYHETESMTNIIEKYEVKTFFSDMAHEFLAFDREEVYDELLIAEDGILSKKSGKEYMVLHFNLLKYRKSFEVVLADTNTKTICISRYMMSNFNHEIKDIIQDRLKLLNTPFILHPDYEIEGLNLFHTKSNDQILLKDANVFLICFKDKFTKGIDIINNILSSNNDISLDIKASHFNQYFNPKFDIIWEFIRLFSEKNILIIDRNSTQKI